MGHRSIHTRENDTGPDDANHDSHGIFIMSQKQKWEKASEDDAPGAPLPGLTLYDIAPTLLRLYGLPVPNEMQGHPIPEVDDLPFFG